MSPASKSTVGVELRDLGDIGSEPVLICGGAYSNLQAFEALLEQAHKLGIRPERIIHTGDVVAYCANPRETSQALRDSKVVCVMGNCEESVGEGKVDCGCGFPSDSLCNTFAANWYAYTIQQLHGATELAEWMGDMPRRVEFQLAGRRFAVIHGAPSLINKFIFPSATDEELLEEFRLLPHVDAIVGGHSGLPFTRIVSQASSGRDTSLLWHNSGALGMPANDGTTRVWFSTLTPKEGGIEVEVHALTYDHKAASDAVLKSKVLNRGYGDALITGIWPSQDILPMDEALSAGVALDPRKLGAFWRSSSSRRRMYIDASIANVMSKAIASPAFMLAVGMSVAVAVAAFAAKRKASLSS